MVTRVLCVAEKNSIAKAVAAHLSGGQSRVVNIQGAQYNKNYEFHCNLPTWGQCDVTMTSVSGHLMDRDFDSQFRHWSSSDPSALFEARINKSVAENSSAIARNIQNKARNSQILYIWTDCDREGEHIGTEIREVAYRGNSQLGQPGKTVRARFSNIERDHIINAAGHPVNLDDAQANAVESRIELDLRIGACFTRKLTLTIRPMLPAQDQEQRKIISYGSCQFPTLGFVVERYFRVRNFIPEMFWSIKLMHEKDNIQVNFGWVRGHLFDRMTTVIIFERCLAACTARVTDVQTRPASKWKPLPLTTVELQKCGSTFLRMDSQRVMNIAEKLYQSGFISYPRTETDQFDRGMDLQSLVRKQAQSQNWGQFAQDLADGGFSQPRQGRNNDKAHPPIHPVNFVAPAGLNTDEQRVYEFVARRFLACCSEDAKGSRTEISILYGTEKFSASGLTVLQRNYLDVYPYDKWTSTQELPRFHEGEEFEPVEARIHEGQTGPPGYLTEPELIALMDSNGIGTDATMAEHIAKIKERRYVDTRSRGGVRARHGGDDDFYDDNDAAAAPAARGRGGGRGGGRGQVRGSSRRAETNSQNGSTTTGVQEFIPTTLGVALIEGYESMGFEVSLAKPFLRKEMEEKMKAICEGRKTRAEVVRETIEQYRLVYARSNQQTHKLTKAVNKYVLGLPV